jgi:hypothetical protein
MNALEALGYEGKEISWIVPARAAQGLRRLLNRGIPVILCVDECEHWVCAVGTIGTRFLVADSADAELVRSYDATALAERWWHKSKKPYYGVTVKRQKP